MDVRNTKLDRILDAAAEVFALKGYDGAKVDQIAQAAGVNKATLYYHLGNKKQLFEAVLTSRFNQAAERLEKALNPQGDPEEELRRLVSLMADIFQKNPVLPRLMIQEVIGGGAHLTRPVVERILHMVGVTAGILERGRAAGVFRPADPFLTHLSLIAPMAMFILSAPLRQMAIQTKISDEKSVGQSMEDFAAHLADTLSLALRAQPPAKEQTA